MSTTLLTDPTTALPLELRCALLNERSLCNIQLTKYHNMRLCISLVDTEYEEPIAKATINLPDYPLPSALHVAIKDYSKNEGMLDFLIESGIVYAPTSGIEGNPVCMISDTYIGQVSKFLGIGE